MFRILGTFLALTLRRALYLKWFSWIFEERNAREWLLIICADYANVVMSWMSSHCYSEKIAFEPTTRNYARSPPQNLAAVEPKLS